MSTPTITTQPLPTTTLLKTKPPIAKTPSTSQISWANKVRVSDSSTRFTLEALTRQPPGHRLQVSDEMLLDNAEQWRRCMVGFFPGYRMPYHAVNTIASRVWKQCGLENVTTTSNGFMIFRFATEEQMHAVLEKGPWMFGGKNIVLQQWHPRIQFDKNKISTLPVWIRLHGLPFPLWSKQGLSLAASMVGKPLSCDESTYNCTRLEYARLCVEIDASLPYVSEFEIESTLSPEPINIKVEYEWKPSRCEKCSIFGHSCLVTPVPAPTTVPVPIPILDKGKHIAIDPIHNQHMIPDPYPSASTSDTTPLLPIINTLPSTTTATSPQSIIAPASLPSLHPLHSGPNMPNAPSATDSTIHPMEQPHSQPTTQPPTIPNDPTSTAQPNPDCSPILQSNPDPITLNTLLFQPLDTTTCMESKMASLQSQSDASSAIEVSAETSTTSVPPSESHDDSPTPSPKTVRKKKGGRKGKEVKGL